MRVHVLERGLWEGEVGAAVIDLEDRWCSPDFQARLKDAADNVSVFPTEYLFTNSSI